MYYLCLSSPPKQTNKMKTLLTTLSFTLLSLSTVAAQEAPEKAQATSSTEINTETASMSSTDSLRMRVEKLEKKAHVLNKIKRHLDISGYGQVGYEWSNDGTSSFYIRRARVSLSGEIFKGRAGSSDYRLQLDFAGSPKILDIYVRYRPFNELGIQMGQFKIPVSIENTDYSPLKLEFIDYSLAVQRLVRMSGDEISGIFSSGRDLGLQLYGGFVDRGGYNLISYNLAVFNGNGINLRDDNKSKDVVGRLMVRPVKDLVIAGYYQFGEGTYTYGEDTFGSYARLRRYGGGISYDCRDFFVRSEYIGGVTGPLLSEGAYAAAGYKFLGKGSVVARFDYFDNDKRDNQYEFNYTVGLNYRPWKFLRLQLNYTLQQYCNFGEGNIHSLNFMVSGIF